MDASVTKRQHLQDTAAPPRAIGCVFDVELLLKGVLKFVDVVSLVSFLEVLTVDAVWKNVLTHGELWEEMTTTHFGGKLPAVKRMAEIEQMEEDEEEEEEEDAESEAVAGTTPDEKVTWIEGVPSQKVVDLACAELKEFLQSAEQLVQFDARVQIVRGDIGEITMVGEQRVDGLAFPTTPFLRKARGTGSERLRVGSGPYLHVGSWRCA